MTEVVVCVYARDEYDRSSQGLLGAGQRLASSLQKGLHVVILGLPSDTMTQKVQSASQRVTVVEALDISQYQPEPYLGALAEVLTSIEPYAVLLANDTYSQEIAPRLAHRLGGSAVGDGLSVSVNEGQLEVARSVYGGKAMATIRCNRFPAVVWIRSRAFEPAQSVSQSAASSEQVTASLPDNPASRIVERKVEGTGESRLEDAQVIISGGRGLGGAEPFEQLKQLAALLGAQLAASRAACDSGWVPPSWQVGQTGKKVAPELYLAIAIHGASQHLAGISDAKVVAAINVDPDAPIFKHCLFGIVEDYRKVVPPLLERLSKLEK